MTISKERRDAIRAAAEKATPGPWEVHRYARTSTYRMLLAERGKTMHAECIPADTATHIANCDPQTILAILDALDAAEAETIGPIGFANPNTLDNPIFTVRGKEAGVYIVPLYERPAPAVREGWKPLPVGPLTDVIDAISDVVEQMDDAGLSRSAIDLVPLRNARRALVRALAATPEAK